MVCPGFMDTDMPNRNLGGDGKQVQHHQDGMKRGKAWEPDYVAKTIVDAASKGQRDVSWKREKT